MNARDTIGLGLLTLAAAGAVAWWAGARRADDGGGPPPPAHVEPSSPGGRHRVPLGRTDADPHTDPAAAERSVWNREAIAALEAGDLARGVALLERCHAGAPQHEVFAANLAEALARLARVEHEAPDTRPAALERLARAVELAPGRDDLADLLDRWRREAETEQGFWTDESDHFLLRYDGERGELLNRGHYLLLNDLEAAYQDFGELFGRFFVEEGRPKVEVLVYRREEFSELTGIGHWAGGVFDGKVRVPIEDLDAERKVLTGILRHELLHAFVKEVGGRGVPGWLNEGLAQWVEAAFLDDRGSRVRRAREKLAGTELFTLDELAGSLATWRDEEAIARAYAQSLAFVAYLEHHYGERLVIELVEGYAADRDAATTFLERTGIPLDAVLTDFAD
ncbi:MAG: hypothetical protein QF903_05785 [Planctomycetota bacterium]|jgi:hypothetical protein|nr:hypothetical protein [Planctomycetota bacterium]MDP6988970.1 hypothetical protein [Planctomycetota bacterium]